MVEISLENIVHDNLLNVAEEIENGFISEPETSAEVLREAAEMLLLRWTEIKLSPNKALINLPNHKQEVIFQYSGTYYIGKFLNDYKTVAYNDDGYDGDFGFFSNDGEFYEAEGVTRWREFKA